MSAHSFDNLKVDLLKSLDFFKPLDLEVIDSLAHNCEEILLNPEEILFEEGELGDAMFLILYGSLSIERQNIVIAKRERGEYVGEMALIESAPRAATVKTYTKTHLLKLSKEQFQSHFTSNPQTLLEILKTISERSREDLEALEQSMKNLQTEKKVTSRLQDLLNSTSNEIYTFDFTTFYFQTMNTRSLKNLGYELGQITKIKVFDILGDIDPKVLDKVIKPLLSNLKTEVEFDGTQKRKDGSIYPVKRKFKLTNDTTPPVIIGIVEDISEIRKLQNKNMELTFYDILTGLPNKRLLLEQLNSAITQAKSDSKIFAVLLIDLLKLKAIKSSLGFEVIDLLLVAIAKRIEAELPPGSILGRLSENEFLVAVSEFNYGTQEDEIASLILKSFQTPIPVNRQDVFVSLSIGISCYPKDGWKSDILIEQAETAAQHNPLAERANTYCHYNTSMACMLKSRQFMERDIRDGLEKNQFELYYQPKWCLKTKTISGVEALMRWNHPRIGMIYPLDFLPMLENREILVSLGDWVLKTACQQMKLWLDMNLPVKTMEINISAQQFKKTDFVSFIKKIINDSEIDPQCIELEVTEAILGDSLEPVVSKLRELRKIGVKVSFDDFGTGNYPLTILSSVPLDILKIHQTFVKHISTEKNALMAKSIISLAKAFNLQTIAVGVETKNQEEILQSFGCDFIQGYLLGTPIPADEVIKLLSPL
jgi:diguanylate cyclase (GGDEF)-like protein/PAS domain S-box-containing protein